MQPGGKVRVRVSVRIRVRVGVGVRVYGWGWGEGYGWGQGWDWNETKQSQGWDIRVERSGKRAGKERDYECVLLLNLGWGTFVCPHALDHSQPLKVRLESVFERLEWNGIK